MHDMHGRGPETRHARQQADAGQHQILDRRLVLVGAVLAVGGDRAGDEPRIEALQAATRRRGAASARSARSPRPGYRRRRRAGRNLPAQGAPGSPSSIERRQRGLEIERRALLAAIPDDEAAVAQVRRSGRIRRTTRAPLSDRNMVASAAAGPVLRSSTINPSSALAMRVPCNQS